MTVIEKILAVLFGSKQERDLKRLIPLVREINTLEPEMLALNDEDFKGKTEEYRERIKNGESLDSLIPEAFALAREAARRVLGERMFDVQLLGGIVLHEGKIMEMKTGEGKTLSSIPAAYLNSLAGKGVHIVTVNDYLAQRDAEWMGPVYEMLGVSVGVILSSMDYQERKIAYGRDITYGTNNEFGFDYLRDNLKWVSNEKTQRGFHYCIVDEIDSILIDEARTPLIISGPAEDDTRFYYEVNRLIDTLDECEKDPETEMYPDENLVGHYKIDEKRKSVSFTNDGMNAIEERLLKRGIITGSLFSNENFEYIHYFTQCMKAHKLFHKDVDYVVNSGKVEIVDEFTGRILHGRRYSDGLHQAIEAKERIKIEQRNRTLATITFQNYFRMYTKIAGMTGTADTEAAEFSKIYSLDVVIVPTNRPVVRDDRNDVIFLTEEDKLKHICEDIKQCNKAGQPVLVGTVSIEKSELISSHLTRVGVRHEVLNAKNHAREALIIAEAGARGSVTIATNMAGRGTDIKLGGNPEYRARKRTATDAPKEVFDKAYAEEYAKWHKDYQDVKDLGGLYVLGTERHEARRIDNQLRGRSGRQGDPGKSNFYISMDDELMRLFGGENLKSLLARVGMKEGEPINHPWINKSIERAQRKVEDRNFEVRKHLLDFDDVLNEQRKYIYARRDEILDDPDLVDRVFSTTRDIVKEMISEYVESNDKDIVALNRLLDDLKETFFYVPAMQPDQLVDMKSEELESYICGELEKELRKKEEQLSKKDLNQFIKSEYLQQIDSKWQDHLENLEALREAVYLRTYSQKNPLLEYKLEGFNIFDEMIRTIRDAIARKIFKVQIHSVEGLNLVLERTSVGSAVHKVLGQFSGSNTGQRREAQPLKVQVKRTQPKVGRNDPCPCGSGKKYKFCHGK
ncbi:MAG: preprotein translocase subunit SecA [Spirochaetales bacterium]|nr:preprotein translocase subunit SecA [Spirochaetales bacterium]